MPEDKPGPTKAEAIANLEEKMKGLKKTTKEYKKLAKALERIEKNWK